MKLPEISRKFLFVLFLQLYFLGCHKESRKVVQKENDTLSEQYTRGIVKSSDSIAEDTSIIENSQSIDKNFSSKDQKKVFSGKSVSTLKDVRAAIQEGFDRVVFEFEDNIPGYKISYIDKPAIQCGSGKQIFLPGDGWLEVKMSPARGYNDDGNATFGKNRIFPNLKNVKQLEKTCDFEAELTWVIAVLSPNKYRVIELQNPPRLVIDILPR